MSTVLAADWPQWRGPNRDGISTETGWSAQWPAAGPKQVWKAGVGTGYSGISVAGGRLYTVGNTDSTDSVYCLDAATGTIIWKHSYPCDPKDPMGYVGPRCTPTVDAGRVYTVSRLGHLFCLDAATGKVTWARELQQAYAAKPPKWGFSGSPLVEGNLLIMEGGGKGAGLVALNKATGVEVWKSGDDAAGYSSAIATGTGEQRRVIMLHARAVVARRVSDGGELWRHPWKTSYDVNAATPILAGDKLFISSGYNHGGALLQIGDGAPRVVWENKNMSNQMNSSVLIDGHLYGFD
jgi:outer membrane protein assembly factor BamB